MIAAFADWITTDLLQLLPGSHGAESVRFFVEDTVKIFALLILITHVMALFRLLIPSKRMHTFLQRSNATGAGYVLASGFGAATPFCTCSSIPLFIGFLQSGASLGIAFAFLITSPLVNEIVVVLLLGTFGWKITFSYVAAGIAIGIAGGWTIDRLFSMREITIVAKEESPKPCQCKCACAAENAGTRALLLRAHREARSIISGIAPYLLIGIGIGALVHGYIPASTFEKYLSASGVFSVPLAVLLGIPLYANASAIVPVLSALVAKGVPLGTALAFSMAAVGLSLPEAIILKRTMTWKLLLGFFGIVGTGIVFIGFLINATASLLL